MPLIILFLVVILLIAFQEYAYRRLWNKGLRYSIRFSAKEAFEGDTLQLLEELENNKALPLPWIYVQMQISKNLVFDEDAAAGSLYSVMMHKATRRKKKFLCQKRGVYQISNVSLSVSNLLHTRHYKKFVPNKNELLVFPKLLDSFGEINLLYRHLDSTVLTNRIINPDPFEFKGIRDYQPGDALKAVNFRASAISQKLMVNIHAPTCAQKLTLVVNVDPHTGQSAELYEHAISLCATLAQHYIGMEISVGFFTNGKDGGTAECIDLATGSSGGHLYHIFECLARMSLNFKYRPMAEFMETFNDKEQMYVIISPNHDETFMTAFHDLERRGVSAFLIVPTFKGMDVDVRKSEKIALWDSGL